MIRLEWKIIKTTRSNPALRLKLKFNCFSLILRKELTEQLNVYSGVDFSNFKFQINATPSFDSCKLLSYDAKRSSGY